MIDRQATDRLIRLVNTFRSVAVAGPRQNREVEKRLVYGGNQSQSRSNGIRITPWNRLFE